MQVLVDTSAFVNYFRFGKNEIVASLAINNSILLSKVVRLELLKGGKKEERKSLLRFFSGLEELPNFPNAQDVENSLFKLHSRGLNLGFADLMILTDAWRTKSALLAEDKQLLIAAKILKVKTVDLGKSL